MKRFDEWETMECNQCELYYLNQCDGVCGAEIRSCKSFKVVRGVVIPQEIKRLKTRLKWLVGLFLIFELSHWVMFIMLFWNN